MAVKHASDVQLEKVEAGTDAKFQVLIGPEEAPNFVMRRFVMQPGGGLPAHTNTVEHEQFVLRGSAKLGLGDEVIQVRQGDVVFIPAGVPHWYRAEGKGPFEMLCLVPAGPDRIEMVKQRQK
jgi:quercetin dioxygenase-like cupin family protein